MHYISPNLFPSKETLLLQQSWGKKRYFPGQIWFPLAGCGRGESINTSLVNNVWPAVLWRIRGGSHEHTEWEASTCSWVRDDWKEQVWARWCWEGSGHHRGNGGRHPTAPHTERASFSAHVLPQASASLLLAFIVPFVSGYATALLSVRFPGTSPSRASTWFFQHPTGSSLSVSLPVFPPAPGIYCMEFQGPGQLLFKPLKALAKVWDTQYCAL